MEIKVFDIGDKIQEKCISDVARENIESIFLKVFSAENIQHIKIGCCTQENTILGEYINKIETFDLNKFSKKLYEAEKKADGSRNKQITKGYLFIKRMDNLLWLLKLENIEVVDKDNDYQMKNSFPIEANYYKGCIFKGELNNITIIDKNKAVAKYWRENFLELSLIKDSYTNTRDMVLLLKNNELLSESIKLQDNFKIIKNEIENYIFENNYFDKTRVADLLRSKELIEQKFLTDIYSEKSKDLDAEFDISGKALKEEYHKTISLSEYTKISTDNFSKLLGREEIKYEGGYITLSVHEDYISKLPEELINGK